MRSRVLSVVIVMATLLLAVPAYAAPTHEEFIVVLKPTARPVQQVASEIAGLHGGEVEFVYQNALQGFTVTLPSNAVLGLSQNPKVAYIEPVREVQAVGTQPIPTGIDRIEGDLNPTSSPMNVDIAILDTGVYIGTNPDGSARSHLDLNLQWVSDCTSAIFYPWAGGCSGSGDFQDVYGHGTHVAGIAAALDNDIGSVGVAPGAVLWSFKVLQNDGTGTTGMILAGIDAVASKASEIEVANMSLGFVGTSQAINDAIANATNAGVLFVVAAGNDAIDASQFSPANSPDVLTVSALADFDGLPGGIGAPTCRDDVDDTLADFSNFGPAVELAAPGVCIFSTHLNDGYATFSGTSMASPFVAGAAARLIAENSMPTNSRSDVEAIKTALIGGGIPQGSECGFTDVDSSPEPLVFVNSAVFGGDGNCGSGTVVNNPPTADFSFSCLDLACDFTDLSHDPDGVIVEHAWDFGDSTTSSEPSPSHEFAASGSYTVSLTVTDDSGDSATTTRDVEVSDGPAPNQPPTASFGSSCLDLDCDFTDTSSDPDGDPLTYDWDFGDGASSTSANPSHTYASAGTYTVTLTVSDGTASDTASSDVSVTEPATSSLVTAGVNPIIVDGRDAEIPINVFDENGDFVGGALVEGVWTYLDRRGRERTVNDSVVSTAQPGSNPFGNAVLTNRFPPNSEVVSFCLTSITADGYEYVPPPITCGYPFDG